MTMLHLEWAYAALALLLIGTAWLNLRQRHWAQAAFWMVLAALFASGHWVLRAQQSGHAQPAQIAGIGVLALALLAPMMRRVDAGEAPLRLRQLRAGVLGHWLFMPALLIPGVTLLIALFGADLHWYGTTLFVAAQQTLMGLAMASLVALLAAWRLTRAPAGAVLHESRRLIDTLGWAALLPLVLAALGGVFEAAGVGRVLSTLMGDVIPTTSFAACVLAYGLGMVVFTVIMGNAFAAFPVLTAGVGLPLLVRLHGADPAVVGSLGMLCGYCGTLLTPMAANFNIVPVALLELKSPWSVIRAQWPTALPLLLFNLFALYLLAMR